jgi:hypothetical protein
LDVGVCESHAWRATIDNGSDRKAMGLAIAGIGSVSTVRILEMGAYVVTLKCVPNVDIVEVVWGSLNPRIRVLYQRKRAIGKKRGLVTEKI